MDTTARRRKIQKVVVDTGNGRYNHDVNMYTESPRNTVPLSEFEELALERLQLLRIIEQASQKGYKLFSDDWKKSIKEDLSKNGLKKYLRLMSGFYSQTEQDFQARRADHLSHFILRLAYCRSEELRKWFISRELEWFKLKFIVQSQQGIKEFLKINQLIYTPISDNEKEAVKYALILSTPGISDVYCDTNDFYKVPFEEVVPLVKNRRVFLQLGWAYIPSNDLVVCIQAKFRANLSEALNIYNHRLPSVDDPRLNSMLTNLHNTYTGKQYIIQSEKDCVDPANLDVYSKKHFPLCMRHVHEVLKSTHHLKHFCRLQYGLFLKGIGLTYEDAMDFWKQEFTKKADIDSDKFDKAYAYTFRHQYGKVGNMTNYSPYSCIKIITNNVGPGEHHGCLFKHWDSSILKQKLIEVGISSEDTDAIMDITKNGHYQIACSKYFEAIHKQAPSMVINHPNQYYVESINVLKEKQSKALA